MAVDYIREQVEAGLIQMEQIPNALNKANVLTKIIKGMQYRTELLGAECILAVRDESKLETLNFNEMLACTMYGKYVIINFNVYNLTYSMCKYVNYARDYRGHL